MTSVPTFDAFIEPLLRVLVASPDALATRNVYESVADRLGLSDEQRAEVLPSGRQPYYKNRIGWAHDRLKRAELSESPRRGLWQVTEAGREFAAKHPDEIPAGVIRQMAFRPAKKRLGEDDGEDTADATAEAAVAEVSGTPEERLHAAYEEIRERVRSDLLDLVLQASPTFFERLVLDLLHSMGYGATRDQIHQTGQSGDGGIDGVITLDRLGLEKVYVQAKRYAADNTVGRPAIQGFFGALAGRRATKGVFITTSKFSKEARDFAASASDSIVLINGSQLATLMIDHVVGISIQERMALVEVDSDYFDEG